MGACLKRAPRRPAVVMAVVFLALAVAGSGCKSIDEPRTEKADKPVTANAVQATLSPDGGAVSSGPWPDKVSRFVESTSIRVWYPKKLPGRMKVEAVDVVEMDENTGLVCDILFHDGKRVIQLVQGSPKNRDYEIVSAGKTAWGSEQADVVREDPQDDSSRRSIVYRTEGNFAELSGDIPFEELKAVAASMVPVR